MTISLITIFVSVAIMFALSEITLKSSIKLAGLLNISVSVVSLTIVAFCTSLPEIIVSFIVGYQNKFNIGFANILGSNNVNGWLYYALFVLLIHANKGAQPAWLHRANMLLLYLSIISGGVVLGLLPTEVMKYSILFTLYLIIIMVAPYTVGSREKGKVNTKQVVLTSAMLLVAVSLLAWTCKYFIQAAEVIGHAIGMDDVATGKIIVAIGTCLPEFCISIAAIARKEMGFIIGDIIGSNIVNILFGIPIVLLMSSATYHVTAEMNVLCIFFIVQAITLFFCVRFIGSRHSIPIGLAFLVLYTVSMAL